MAKFSLQVFDETVREITTRDSRYAYEAYIFVSDALNFTHDRFKKKRHVSGQQLLEGIRQFALDQFGPMTLTVLHEWGIKTTEDFGHIVFNMVEAKLMGKTKNDSIEDFKNAYDFKKAFVDDYKIEIPE